MSNARGKSDESEFNMDARKSGREGKFASQLAHCSMPLNSDACCPSEEVN